MRIGLDVDGVLANFVKGIIKESDGYDFPKTPEDVKYWNICDDFTQVFDKVKHNPEFWLGLEPLRDPKLPFIPQVYITSRPINSWYTKKWLDLNGFPKAQVITVSYPEEKERYCSLFDLDYFVDDYYGTIQILEGHKKCKGVLYKSPYQVGHVEECKNLTTVETLEELWKSLVSQDTHEQVRIR